MNRFEFSHIPITDEDLAYEALEMPSYTDTSKPCPALDRCSYVDRCPRPNPGTLEEVQRDKLTVVDKQTGEPMQSDEPSRWVDHRNVDAKGVAVVPLTENDLKDADNLKAFSDDILAALKDSRTKALVLEIGCPGGNGNLARAASTAVQLVNSQKPVVAFAVRAGSGGYMVACEARKIVAGELSSVGGIGSGIVLCVDGRLKAFGSSKRKAVGLLQSYPPALADQEEGERLARRAAESCRSGAVDFAEVVALNRGLDYDKILDLAAESFFGRDALKHGLIDQIGSMDEAKQLAAELAAQRERK